MEQQMEQPTTEEENGSALLKEVKASICGAGKALGTTFSFVWGGK